MSRMIDIRREALRRALARDPDAAVRRTALHPEAEELRGLDDDGTELAELLWAELEGLEERHGLGASGGASRGGPADFFARRRRLERVREVGETTSTLPTLWSRIVRLPAVTVAEGTVDLGVLVIAGIVEREDRHRIVKELAPLGSALTRRVAAVAHGGRTVVIDPILAGAWRLQYSEDAKVLSRARLASRIGRRLLSTLFRQLPESSRRAAVAAARSNIFKKLEAATALPLPRPADVDVAATLAERVYVGGPEAHGLPAEPVMEEEA